jgi:hypothetical protein
MYITPAVQQCQFTRNSPSERFSNQFSADSVSYLLHFCKKLSAHVCKVNEKAEKARAVPTLEIKLKIIAYSEAGK